MRSGVPANAWAQTLPGLWWASSRIRLPSPAAKPALFSLATPSGLLPIRLYTTSSPNGWLISLIYSFQYQSSQYRCCWGGWKKSQSVQHGRLLSFPASSRLPPSLFFQKLWRRGVDWNSNHQLSSPNIVHFFSDDESKQNMVPVNDVNEEQRSQ